MKICSFTEISAWKEARVLVSMVYGFTSKEPVARDYGFKDQIQRAAVSIMSNIAEGFDSSGDKSFANFLYYSLRSASEVESLLYVALDIKYIDAETFSIIQSQTATTKKLIFGFIKYLNSNQK